MFSLHKNRLLLLLLLFTSPLCQAARLNTPGFDLSISARTPEQIAAFYEARGFPKQAVEILKQQCYLTVYFKNKSNSIIWLELNNWQFMTPTKPVQRRDRGYWKTRWAKMGLAMRFQSTFRWTLMPEQLDFRPHEREGGNIILPYTAEPVHLEAIFRFQDGGEEHREIYRVENILCKR